MSDRPWWQDAVVYQVYIRSFADSDGDGIGDLEGLRSRLDHLEALGVDALWLNPCYPSPQRDHGYDVADYFGIHHEYGDLATFDALVADAARRGIRILMDLVPNHCSSDHPLFRAALAAAPGSAERAWFWFRDGRDDGEGDAHGAPPNNWLAAFGGSAWTRVSPHDPQWYLGTFTPDQPDFDHGNPVVDEMFGTVLDFWFDRGVDGFRVDAVGPVGKHPDLPDQPPVPPGTHPMMIPWENPYTVFRPEGHDVWRTWRRHLDSYVAEHPGRELMIIAEVYTVRDPELALRFMAPDQFHQTFAFDLMLPAWDVASIQQAVRDPLSILDHGVPPAWTLNNHDVQRVVTRLGRADVTDPEGWSNNALDASIADVDLAAGLRRARALITLAMVLPGPIYLYQGEELGLPEVLDLDPEDRQDPVFLRTGGHSIGRDGCRVPFPWTRDPATSFGFSGTDGTPIDAPWLPQPDDWGDLSLEAAEESEDPILELYTELIAARRKHLLGRPLETHVLDFEGGLVVVERADITVALNVTGRPIAIDTDHPSFRGRTIEVSSAPGDMHTPGVIPPDAAIWLVPAP